MKTKTKVAVLTPLAFTALYFVCSISKCSRPTKYESTISTNWNNSVEWEGMGPGTRWFNVFGEKDQDKVSHMQKQVHFPKDVNLAEEDMYTVDGKQKSQDRLTLEAETQQSIMTAENKNGVNQIVIQNMLITYEQGKTWDAVRARFVEHRPEDMKFMEHNLDGLVRSYLQTKTIDYIEARQQELSESCLNYIKDFKLGGIPVYKDGVVSGFTEQKSFEDVWGINVTGVKPLRVKRPSYVVSAGPEGERIIKDAQRELGAVKDECERRRTQLKSIDRFAKAIGNNPTTALFLKNQEFSSMIEDLGPQNIENIEINKGLTGDKKANYAVSKNR